MFKTQFKLGKHPLAIESNNVEEFFLQCAVFSQVPASCGHCGSDDIRPHGERKPDEDWVFMSVRCCKCGYQLRFGKRRDGGLFLKEQDGWQAPFRRDDRGGASSLRYSGNSGRNSQSDATDVMRLATGGSGSPATSSSAYGGMPPVADEEDDIPF